jgi:YidC/Oxa1 family membrane protein insertase
MEKRVIVAVLLMTAVIFLTNLLFPPPDPVEEEAPTAVAPVAPLPEEPPVFERIGESRLESAPEETVEVASPLYRHTISSRGGALIRAELPGYASYTAPSEPVQLVPDGVRDLLTHRLVVGADTVDLRGANFRVEGGSALLDEDSAPHELRLVYGEGEQFGVEMVYTFHPDQYQIQIRGRVRGLGAVQGMLLTELGTGLAPHEDPAHRSERQLAVVARPPDRGVENLRMEKLRAGQQIPGPLAWAGVKDKYFLIALITPPLDAHRFAAVHTHPLPAGFYTMPRGERADTLPLPRALTQVALPLGREDGTFAFDAYLGPQEHERLVAIGQGLQEVNPYGYRWLRPVIRPIAAAILWVLDGLNRSLGITYGWVLVIFGVMMRVVLWPLNAKAMRAQMKNMAVQPILQAKMQEVREKYKDDPARLQKEMMGVYQEVGVSPLSMLSGCLPLLIPMPILITLFFVFQDSIVFRGESFLWLPDLSLADPYFILPVFLVVSMFALQWVSFKMSGMEQNPQMKMMMYMMPLVMGFIFFMLPAGLNLYYSVTNVATIPQQLLISKERKKAQAAMKEKEREAARSSKPASAGAAGGGGGGARSRRPGRRSKKRG